MTFKESRPIFLQIADRLCEEILLKRYVGGERIPGVREYAAMMEVNVNTVVRSFDYLQRMGVIQNRRGIGYFVEKGAVDHIYTMRREEFLTDDLPYVFRQMLLLDVSLEDMGRLFATYKEKYLRERKKDL